MNYREISKKRYLLEGGNYLNAQQIPSSLRTEAVKEITKVLMLLNSEFQKQHGYPIWTPELFRSKQFLSGSSLHFFDLINITGEVYQKVKERTGDVDTQVDKNIKEPLNNTLDSLKGKNIKGIKLLDFKADPAQFITLWELSELKLEENPLRVQVDLELVEYEDSKPTAWSKFAHSSSWEDLTAGVKGVFHKYLMRAFTTKSLSDRYVQSAKGKLKLKKDTDLAFSVDLGLRPKYEPVLDDKGNQLEQDGVLVYKEIPTKQSKYTTDLHKMFVMLFDKEPSSQELRDFWSFTGGIKLAKKLLSKPQQVALMKGFAHTLFNPNTGQALYKADPQRDLREKTLALKKLVDVLGLSSEFSNFKSEILQSIDEFYKKKYPETDTSALEPQAVMEADVVTSKREGIEHIEKMKPQAFVELLKALQSDLPQNTKFKLTLKIDGLGARFGKNADGEKFFESSHSGPQFSAKAFSRFAQERNQTPEKIQRAQHYDDILDLIINSELMEKLPDDCKVHCEILYLPLAEIKNHQAKFVSVYYDTENLGKIITIVPFFVEVASTGELHPQSDEIKEALIKSSTPDIKVIDDRLNPGEIKMSAIGDIQTLIDMDLTVMQSRKKADAEARAGIEALFAVAKTALAQHLLKIAEQSGRHVIGKDLEGVILHTPQGRVKATSKAFKDILQSKKAAN